MSLLSVDKKFKKSFKKWTIREDNKLKRLYIKEELELIEISIMHKRTPGAIISRLIKNNIVNNKLEIRGFKKYTNSDFYKNLKNKKIITKEEFDLMKTDLNFMKEDLEQIKIDINSLNKDFYKLKSILLATFIKNKSNNININIC